MHNCVSDTNTSVVDYLHQWFRVDLEKTSVEKPHLPMSSNLSSNPNDSKRQLDSRKDFSTWKKWCS